ncbi:unnamed protein product [Menidia menidia]|uniref:(Atlantic silverside) hypothetical protein n=1 Tax=Menidia menidia TaxID=238744 RepID=A0A8S4BLI5_9TELE|nr:unnamed protein product [Menidia menidia]
MPPDTPPAVPAGPPEPSPLSPPPLRAPTPPPTTVAPSRLLGSERIRNRSVWRVQLLAVVENVNQAKAKYIHNADVGIPEQDRCSSGGVGSQSENERAWLP